MKKISSVMLILILLMAFMPQGAFADAETYAADEISNNSELKGVISFGADKVLVSPNETVTFEVKTEEGYEACWIYLNKPMTGKRETVYLYESAITDTYRGTLDIKEHTESGLWTVERITLKNSDGKFISYMHESADLSNFDFEVCGTDPDIVAPVIKSYSVDKNIVSPDEYIEFCVEVEEENPSSIALFWYKTPSGETKLITLKRVGDSCTYTGRLLVTENMEEGIYKPSDISVSDGNNSSALYNSKVTNYKPNEDMSSMNFEVIGKDATGNQEQHIVIFTDGMGKPLSTQRVADGESAVAPAEPVRDRYLFDGWDVDYSNVTEDLTVNATWRKDPNAQYDEYMHQGESLVISLESGVDQSYTFECDEENVDFKVTYTGSSSVIIGSWGRYTKKYSIKISTPGYYTFTIYGSAGGNTLQRTVAVSAHEYESAEIAPTCTEIGGTKYTCAICEDSYMENEIEALGHSFTDYVYNNDQTCTEDGTKTAKCDRCDATDTIVDDTHLATGHRWTETIDKQPTCEESGIKSQRCTVCGAKQNETVIDPLGHKYMPVITAPTATKAGYTTYTCRTCGDSYIEDYVKPLIFGSEDSIRRYGQNRYDTSVEVAKTLKTSMQATKFDNIIVADGRNYADALAGTYLAKVKNAPILVVGNDAESQAKVRNYITSNLKSGGTVYILGGEGAVSKSFADSLKGYNVSRLWGKTRFETNIAILKAAGVKNEDILVCSGLDFADSLSASSAGKPILLVDKSLSSTQKTYLKGLSSKRYYIIGGTGAVNANIANELKSYGTTKRVYGQNRYATSVAVAREFFGTNCDAVVLAYGLNFPDGLSGGPLAMSIGAPLILATGNDTSDAAQYVKAAGADKVIVLGGPTLISNEAVKKIMN